MGDRLFRKTVSMDFRKMVLLLVGMLCVCIYGNSDTAPSALTILTTLLARVR